MKMAIHTYKDGVIIMAQDRCSRVLSMKIIEVPKTFHSYDKIITMITEFEESKIVSNAILQGIEIKILHTYLNMPDKHRKVQI